MKKKKIINQYNILGVNIQILITILVVVFGVITLITGKYLYLLEFSMAADLFIMAYNNHSIYHKQNATVIYIVVGVIMIIIGILSVLGVV